MTKDEILALVLDKYQTQPEYLWKKYPSFAVLRHNHNRKWYGLLMDVEKDKLGLAGSGKEDLLNLKLPDDLISILQADSRFLPAYHMNKAHWISLRINEFDSQEIANYLQTSYELTQK
ncbi:hypothetical protein FC52_GL000595 [Lactobacillus pasteurii DSM 23907 = CRBIP 24.76]|uniref:MmcQ protein n=1 Tax=Lactobacillus pasteurii DSM 23907 = CRBIP 24.76 TaxID=1423790 RepID=I7JZ41_9LACO|nr:MmcQ/YjbR family DNA-binding protein [Lactobacillus pasteurii]KRK08894.1 hypothetical protein FC52_GL000595 [Lactobacillus pasteurii DSM 23907 = CRBIP 24.76]TDG76271.1 hypothetical protein C5L33_001030 [Lactobacillus pasteurii]CCI86005.1 MmcQ protein [Lactobacillus pasteurii DSM 23907 = CRBIP 24.76]